MDGDGRDIDAITPQALDVDAAEIVLADAADHAAGLAELRDLVDEDGGRAGGERTDQRDRFQKPSPISVAMISTRISPMVMIFFMVAPQGCPN